MAATAIEIGAIRTQLDHMCSLHPRNPGANIRKTGIIATLGPSSCTEEVIQAMIRAGMNIARLNLAHGTHQMHCDTITLVRDVAERMGVDVGIAVDTQGPVIRTGAIDPHDPSAEVRLKEGSSLILCSESPEHPLCTSERVVVQTINPAQLLRPGSEVLLDDGLIVLKVHSVNKNGDVECIVETGGRLDSNKRISFSNARIEMETITEKDREDIKFAVEQDVDMIFVSFVQDSISLKDIRIEMGARGADIKLVAKIENAEGIHNVSEILSEADAIMIARGCLGVTIPAEKVFIAQKGIIAKCNVAGKPVICATQMLESMITNPRPTRAECSDIANAVLDGTDCVMLSGETAKGKHPVKAIENMHQVCVQAEAAFYTTRFLEEITQGKMQRGKVETLSLAATTAAVYSQASAIVILSVSGVSARMLSKFRPPVPILTLCISHRMARHMHLHRGVIPVFTPLVSDGTPDGIQRCLQFGIDEGLRRELLHHGDQVITINLWPTTDAAITYNAMMRVMAVE